jgi:cobyrinic acid a,c-diamide synthase
MIDIPRVMLAADRSSSGKTTIVAGLLYALCRRGLRVQPFKVAMDYIDPSYHTWITGRHCRNLDGYLMKKEAISEVYSHGAAGAEIAVIEGVRGLYEGFDGDVGSTAQIAKQLSTPVIFVVDARSITRSAAALVKGYMDYDRGVDIKGVILNKVGSKRHAEKARSEIERYARVEVVGVIPRNDSMHLSMRHLGLVPMLEGSRRHVGFLQRLEAIRNVVEDGLDIDRILEIAAEAPALQETTPDIYQPGNAGEGLRIGVAVDEAFNFYYRDNLELIELAGAEVVPVSPLHDSCLPRIDGLYIGGGYPELYAKELSQNVGMRRSIVHAHERGMPIFAECGGLMYMGRDIEWSVEQGGCASGEDDRRSGIRHIQATGDAKKPEDDGGPYEMVGLVPGSSRKGSIRVVSYVSGSLCSNCILGSPRTPFMGHEFHHSEMVMDETRDTAYAIRLERGSGIKGGMDGFTSHGLLASYSHIHAASFRGFPVAFLKSCREGQGKA